MKFIFLSIALICFSSTLIAQQTSAAIQTAADEIKSKEGNISFDYAAKLLELAKAYQLEKNFEKANTLDQEVDFILTQFADSIPENYEVEYAISENLENLRLEQYLTRWQGLMRQEQFTTAQALIKEKDWIERSIKVKAYLDIMNLLQVAHQTIGSQHPDYLENWKAAYFNYTSVNYYNLQQASNLWKAITLHRKQETKEESNEHLEVLFGHASFCNRTNDTETYQSLKITIEKHWPYAFGGNSTIASNSPTTKKTETPNSNRKKKNKDIQTNEKVDDPIFTLVEEMPRFPGCETMKGDSQEKKACADQQLLRFIYKKIKYPEIARENGIQGMAVVSFTVTEYGTIIDSKILRNPGGACGEEALRIVNLMNELPSRWSPGKQEGKSVRVKYNLPVRFKLN